MYTNEIEIACGSVAGALHRRLGRPNQDAAHVVQTPHGTAIAVCDGCGSGARSEIGAAVGARLWTAAIAEQLATGAPVDFAAIAATVLERLAVVAAALGERAEVTRDHLLFTSLCAAITDDELVVAAIGDGVIGLGDEVVVLGPFADNQPPYLTEAWFGVTHPPVVWRRLRRDVGSVMLATDGAVPISRDGFADLTAADVLYRNRVALTRRLGLLADDRIEIDWDAHRTVRHAALLDDDTTVVLARWSQP